jgi:hypothetical protein
METITADRAAEIIAGGGTVYPYPRKKLVSVNGRRAQPATPAALRLAVAELNEWRAARAAGNAVAAAVLRRWKPARA